MNDEKNDILLHISFYCTILLYYNFFLILFFVDKNIILSTISVNITQIMYQAYNLPHSCIFEIFFFK